MDLQKNLKVIIFDFDGTLHDLAVDWQQARQTLGVIDSSESLGKAVERLKEQGKKEPLLQLSELEAQALNSEKLDKETRNVLLKLHTKYKIAVFSRNSSKVIADFLQKSDVQVDYIIGRDEVRKLKPDPEGLKQILHFFSCRPQEALLIGDTWHDLLVAQATNMMCVIVGENYTHNTEVPANRIKNIKELESLLIA